MQARRSRWGAVLVAIYATCVGTGEVLARPEADVVPPARAGLAPIELPKVDALEPSVIDHLRETRRTFDQRVAKGSTRDIAEAYSTLGRVFHAYEFLDAAETCYRNATRVRPDDAASLHLLGYLYQQRGRFDAAIDAYRAARRVAPMDFTVTMHLGEVFLASGRLRDARVEFESQQDRFPAAAAAGLGEVALRDERYRDAVSYLEAALRRMPGANALEYPLAMAYRGLGRLDEARAHLARRGSGNVRVADAIVEDLQAIARGERALVLQGRRAYDAGQFQQAAELFRKALAAAPSSVPARVNLGQALLQSGDAAAAIEQFQVALHAAPEDEQVSTALIRMLMSASRDGEAIEVFARTQAFATEDEDALLKLSLALAAHERYRDAASLLDRGQREYPDRQATATTLARLLAASPDRSIRDGERALELANVVYERDHAAAYAETVALALSELGRCDEATEWMRRAITQAGASSVGGEAARLRAELPRYEQRPCTP